MSDVIKRSDAIEAIEIVDWYHQNRNKDMVSGANSDEHQAWYKADDVYKAIETAPTIDAVEVVRGEWIDEADKYDASFGIHDYRCSNCNSYADEYICGHDWYTAGKPNFCPNCGARMKGADDE